MTVKLKCNQNEYYELLFPINFLGLQQNLKKQKVTYEKEVN